MTVVDAPRLHRYTFREYLELEAASTVRHEFLAGEIYAMAGGTPLPAALAMSVGAALLAALRGRGCRVHSSDLRVRVQATGLATYPDVTVVCGPNQTDPESPTSVVNPSLVVEVTSDSSEEYDRGQKLDHYRTIPSLSSIVLVSHRERLIEVWARDGDGWQRSEGRRGARVTISSLKLEVSVDEIYDAAEA